MRLKGMSIEEAEAIIISYAKENIIANTRVGIAFDTVLRELDKIESRPKGEWKKDIGCCECSNCGWIVTAGDEEINNYCPHCGADMRGENE